MCLILCYSYKAKIRAREDLFASKNDAISSSFDASLDFELNDFGTLGGFTLKVDFLRIQELFPFVF